MTQREKAVKTIEKAMDMQVAAKAKLDSVLSILGLPEGWAVQFVSDGGAEFYNENDDSSGFNTYTLKDLYEYGELK